MLKLKIGDNYLLTTKFDSLMDQYIIYTMSCFQLHNKLLLGFNIMADTDFIESVYINTLKEERANEVYLLTYIKQNDFEDNTIHLIKAKMGQIIRIINAKIPNIKVHIVKMNNLLDSREFKLGAQVYEMLKYDNNSIVNYLDKLETYKKAMARQKAIPNEIKLIRENIKALSKEEKVNKRVITLKDLEYLHLLDSVNVEGNELVCEIQPLQINPSEPLGRIFSRKSFENNKYLRKAAEYIYKGCHFGMVGTKISIDQRFTPVFIETLDHQFDDMFERGNWSSIGYLHFGRGHLCGGEFNDVIAHAAEHGLEYYFLCLKQYITTANVRDYAGKKVWWYPIYDDKNRLVYCAGLDILRTAIIRKLRAEREDRLASVVEEMSIQEFNVWRHEAGYSFRNIGALEFTTDDPCTHSNKQDEFLLYCQEKNKELYNELMKGAE